MSATVIYRFKGALKNEEIYISGWNKGEFYGEIN